MTETMEQYMSKTRGDYGGSEHEDANEHIEKVLDMLSISHPNNSQDQIMLQCFPVSSDWSCQHMIRTRPSGSITTVNFKTKARSTKTSDGLAAIQAQLNNLGREIKKVNEKVYAAQVGCELCKGPHYTKDYPQKEEGKTLEEAYYTQFGAPYQPGRQYRAAGPGFYQ
ncbi:hypothetical protein Tco_0933912 [Tanacetum coccineum]